MLFYYIYRLPLRETAIGILLIGPIWGLMMRGIAVRSERVVRMVRELNLRAQPLRSSRSLL